MGYSQNILTVLRRRSDTLDLLEHKSIFENSSDVIKEPKRRWVVLIAGMCVALLFLTSLVLFLAPADNHQGSTKIRSGHEDDEPRHVPDHVITKEDCSTYVSSVCTVSVIENATSPVCDVRCSRIRSGDHPGHVAADFLAKIYPLCKVCVTWWLQISLSSFPDNRVDTGWLDTNEGELPPISELFLNDCDNLRSIDSGALASTPALANYLKHLTINNNRGMAEIRTGLLIGLRKLVNFMWRENALLERVDPDAIEPLGSKLQVLEVKVDFANASVIASIVGSCLGPGSLSTLEILDLSFSKGLPTLSSDMISALGSTMKSLYLHSSDIKYLEDETVFASLRNSLAILDLRNNQLMTIPNKTLSGFNGLSVSLEGNRWHCDCHLQWLQDLINEGDSSIVLEDEPKCVTPSTQAGVSLRTADMRSECFNRQPPEPVIIDCGPSPTTTPTTTVTMTSFTKTTTTSTSTDSPGITIKCHVFVPPSSFLSDESDYSLVFPTRIPGFRVVEEKNERQSLTSVIVHTGLTTSTNPKSLVWSDNSEVVGCLRDVSGNIRIENLTRDRSYSFCMMDSGSRETSPTHCLALTTEEAWSERSWIDNDMKTLAITLMSVAGVMCLLAGAACVVFAFWKRPTLLTFNKRVVEVKTSRHDAIVMPHPTLLNSNSSPGKDVDTVRARDRDGDSVRARDGDSIRDMDAESAHSEDPSYVVISKVSRIGLFAFRFREWLRRNNESPPKPSVTPAPFIISSSSDQTDSPT